MPELVASVSTCLINWNAPADLELLTGGSVGLVNGVETVTGGIAGSGEYIFRVPTGFDISNHGSIYRTMVRYIPLIGAFRPKNNDELL